MAALYASRQRAVDEARALSRANGSPVAVVYDSRTLWFRVVEDPEELDTTAARDIRIIYDESETTNE